MSGRYTISQMTALFGVTARALRFYEDKGLLQPAREGLARIYSDRDRVRVGFIVQGRKVGFTLDELKELLDLYHAENGQEAQRAAALAKFRERVGQLEQQKLEIDRTIAELGSWIKILDGRSDGGEVARRMVGHP